MALDTDGLRPLGGERGGDIGRYESATLLAEGREINGGERAP